MILFWSYAVTQFLFLLGSKSKDQKDGSSDPKEQLNAPKEASNVAREQSGTAKKSSPRKRPRLDEATEVSKAVSPSLRQLVSLSLRQLEAAREDQEAGVANEVKFQTQIALALLTFSAGAIISAKGTTFARQQAGQRPVVAGGQAVNLLDFVFWWSIGLWFIGLLVTTFTTLVTSFWQKSPGMLFYAKIINAFSLCVSVAGVAFWIFS